MKPEEEAQLTLFLLILQPSLLQMACISSLKYQSSFQFLQIIFMVVVIIWLAFIRFGIYLYSAKFFWPAM